MIAFDCGRCGKALIVPSARAGGAMACPGCGAELRVPPPRPPRQAGRRLWVPAAALAVVLVGVVAVPWFVRARRPALVRERFAAELHALHPHWRGTDWRTCDPRQGAYEMNCYYADGQRTYTF